MNRRRFLPLLIAAILLTLGAAAACDNGDGGDGADTATSTTGVTPEHTTTPATGVTPEDSGENGQSDETSFSEADPEYQLASIDAGEPLSVNDPSIGIYAGLLDSLDEKCEGERSLIGAQAVLATELLADEGISITVLEALQGMDGSIPEESPTLSCAEVASAWFTLTVGQ